jgi:hypothetical protein
MASAVQRDEFERTGLLRLPGAVPAADAAAMCDRVWAHVRAEHGIERTDPTTWLLEERLPGLRKVAGGPEFERLGSPAVRSTLDGLLGEWSEPPKWGVLLVTFPRREQTEWDVPFGVWHNDFVRYDAKPGLRAVQLFVLLNDIRPGGGATLVLTGSHQLVGRYADPAADGPRPKRLRQVLGAAHPWLRQLWTRDGADGNDRVQRYMVDGAVVDGVPLRVVELTGQAGDPAD